MKRLSLLCALALVAACAETPSAVEPAEDGGPRLESSCDKGGMTMGGGQAAPCQP